MDLHWPPKQGPTKLAESLETGGLKTSIFSDFSTTLSWSYEDYCYRKKECKIFLLFSAVGAIFNTSLKMYF